MNVRRKTQTVRISYLMISIFIFFIASKFLTIRQGALERASSYFLYPFLLLQERIVTPLKSWSERRKSNEELEKLLLQSYQEHQELFAKNIEIQSAIAYFDECKELIDFKKRYSGQAIVAQILMKNFSENMHFMFVDAGSVRGIKPDMVVVYKNCLVGRVTHVYPYYSQVLLITDPTCKIASQTCTTKAQGIHEGLCKLHETKLTFVSHLEQLKQDDLIISTGEGLVFPKGYGIGKIKSFELDGFHYRVIVEPLLDLSSLKNCSIIEKGAEFLSSP